MILPAPIELDEESLAIRGVWVLRPELDEERLP